MSGPRILFVVDAGRRVGGGHVMRSLTLARALEAQGASIRMLGPPEAAALLEAFAPEVLLVRASTSTPADRKSVV